MCIDWNFILNVITATSTLLAVFVAVWQTIKAHRQNIILHKQNLGLSEHTLKYETYTYLVIDKVKVLDVKDNPRKPAENSNVIKTLPLTEGIHPSEVKYRDTDFAYVESWGEERSHVNLCEGKTIDATGNLRLIAYSFQEPFTSNGYTHCTPIQLVFYGKSVNELSVTKLKIRKLEFALEGQRRPYGFSVDLNEPMEIDILPAADSTAADCNHQFHVKLFLIHDTMDMVNEKWIDGINLIIEAAHINSFGVETFCQQVVWFAGTDFTDKKRAPEPFIFSIDISTNAKA